MAGVEQQPGHDADRDREAVRDDAVSQRGDDRCREGTPMSGSSPLSPASTIPSPPGVVGTMPRILAAVNASSTRLRRGSAPSPKSTRASDRKSNSHVPRE